MSSSHRRTQSASEEISSARLRAKGQPSNNGRKVNKTDEMNNSSSKTQDKEKIQREKAKRKNDSELEVIIPEKKREKRKKSTAKSTFVENDQVMEMSVDYEEQESTFPERMNIEEGEDSDSDNCDEEENDSGSETLSINNNATVDVNKVDSKNSKSKKDHLNEEDELEEVQGPKTIRSPLMAFGEKEKEQFFGQAMEKVQQCVVDVINKTGFLETVHKLQQQL